MGGWGGGDGGRDRGDIERVVKRKRVEGKGERERGGDKEMGEGIGGEGGGEREKGGWGGA